MEGQQSYCNYTNNVLKVGNYRSEMVSLGLKGCDSPEFRGLGAAKLPVVQA